MRRILRSAGLACLTVQLVAAAPAGPPATFSPVRPGTTLTFPRDHGAHPGFRTEWWYVTGWLKTADGRDLGFQITFFRSRLAVDPANPSAFSPSQILFAHAGLSDPAVGRLLHDGRIARQGLGLADQGSGVDRSAERGSEPFSLQPGEEAEKAGGRGAEVQLGRTEHVRVRVQAVPQQGRAGPHHRQDEDRGVAHSIGRRRHQARISWVASAASGAAPIERGCSTSRTASRPGSR